MKVLKYFAITVSVFLIIFNFAFGLYKISDGAGYSEKPQDYKCILTVWNTEGFYGGGISQRQFLFDVGCKFEKIHNGVLVSVRQINKQTAIEEMNKGNFPDIFSFCGKTDFYDRFVPLDGINAFSATRINGKTYALPWAMGAYALIKKPQAKTDVLLAAEQQDHFSDIAVYLSGSVAEQTIYKSSDEAYGDFIAGATYYMGTQRDVIRLSDKGYDFECDFISEYNDLFRYVAVTAEDSERINYCKMFASYLLSENIQSSVQKTGLRSYYYGETSDNGKLDAFYKTQFSFTLSPFATDRTLFLIREAIKDNDTDSVKNYLVKL